MVPGQPTDPDDHAPLEPRVVIEISGPNVVVRATAHIDRAYTTSLADVINAASDTHTCVVIDPEPIRCDDTFAAYQRPDKDRSCTLHDTCRPVGAEVAMAGVVRIPAQDTVWLIDVSKGRLCQVDHSVDPRFLSHDAWTPIVAVSVTPTRLTALNTNGTQSSAARAHPARHGSPATR